MPHVNLTINVPELLVLTVAAWRGIVHLRRIADMYRDFPPHRHVNGHIVYPKGYAPETIGEIQR